METGRYESPEILILKMESPNNWLTLSPVCADQQVAFVQIVDELVGLIKAERAFESNSKLINSSSNILQLTNNMS